MDFTRMLLLCDLLYMILLVLITQFHLWFQRSKTLPWKIALKLNHYRLSSAGGGSSVDVLGLCDMCSFLVLGHIHKRRCHNLMGLSEMIMVKVLKKEPVWLLSLTQTVFKLTRLSLDASPLSRCLRSPPPQPNKRLQTGKVTGYYDNQNWWWSWKLFGTWGSWYHLKYYRSTIDWNYAILG